MNRRKFLSLCGLGTIAGAFPVGAFAATGLAAGGFVNAKPGIVGERVPELGMPKRFFDSLPSVEKRIADAAPLIVKQTIKAIEEARIRGLD